MEPSGINYLAVPVSAAAYMVIGAVVGPADLYKYKVY